MFCLIFNALLLYGISCYPAAGLIILPFGVLIDITVFYPIWKNILDNNENKKKRNTDKQVVKQQASPAKSIYDSITPREYRPNVASSEMESDKSVIYLPNGYPFRRSVEVRQKNGRLTTYGFAANHPSLFHHWASGSENVFGEKIDKEDWNAWKANYRSE